ncbi:hypothetical protein KL86PLE_100489 [uncultured Pleomorphomonas sp.]|uniref:Uncharacterized protein n=1 Tax=uncultured Pleomorphomonas sp. TaxID=442121 RepID=A0A212L3T1_9HYPH|nr:hypothetical protein KL86PLE_100489 [uncultured Pleomorphomonas sp.]
MLRSPVTARPSHGCRRLPIRVNADCLGHRRAVLEKGDFGAIFGVSGEVTAPPDVFLSSEVHPDGH